MVGSLLWRGMLVGLIAGLIAFAFARVYGEPYVDKSIMFEQSHEASVDDNAEQASATSHHDEEEVFSRHTQAGIGLLTALLVYGTALGGIFACLCAFCVGRFGRLNAKAISLLLAVAAFVSVFLIPQIKYPANPPAVGSPETIVTRTETYFTFIVFSILVMVLAFIIARKLSVKLGALNAAILCGLGYLVLMFVMGLIMPTINEVPSDFSADVLWHFRLASFGIQAILWLTLGIGFGYILNKRLKNSTQ